MKLKNIKILFLLSLFVLGSFFVAKNILANEVKAPILLNAYQVVNEDQTKIVVNGLTENLTDCQVSVSIYINNLYYSTANISSINDEFCSLTFESGWIKKEKSFEITAIARDNKTLTLSPASLIKIISIKKFVQKKGEEKITPPQDENLNKKIIQEVIAPTLFTPTGKIIDPERPVVSGLAANDSLIKIYVDDILENQFWVNNNPSNTANFLYSLKTPLQRGSHLVYAIAQNKDGKESKKSNNLYFNQYKPKITATTSNAELSEENKTMFPTLSVKKLHSTTKQEIKGSLEEAVVKTENKEKNNDFKIKLAIFILFLVVVTLWMILVNKELKKEKGDTK